MPSPLLRALPFSLLLLVGGCAPAQVRVPADFGAEALEMKVTGISPRWSGDAILFGPYSVRRLDDGGAYRDGASVGRASFWQQWHPWAFTLTSPGQSAVDVQCEASRMALAWGDARSETELDLTGLEGPMLGCGLRRDPRAPAHTLEINRRGNRFAGELVSPSAVYRIVSLHAFEGSPITSGEPVGFEFSDRGRVVMVVDVLNQGRVLLHAGTDGRERSLLAAAATALLTAGAIDPG
ncbi:hypothetical protein [Arenimonas donghaensis]|uniref:Uncharacterized protein n=1 Tax=Arenimonas donghaensis DSM 18148 = HO3-R19 TaxID=1121014 RepID=A0A087MKC2_9GAMM|nr:hypothetical protein [Arenimonas donghaensis]KFL37325.1 hypothetical protein N788_10015 [Arenimonas donghaensis DSM 18148 = HO3-R19]